MAMFVTDFKRVATEGKTIDDREISGQELIEMAESYDPEEFTALIWYEHYRFFGNFGKVVELKADKDKKDRVVLYAKLQPNMRLMQLNKEEQSLFNSIEIKPNFSGTGKAYLSGIAVTDSPASLGTEELRFSKRGQEKENYFSEPIEFDVDTIVQEMEASSNSLVNKLLKVFSSKSENQSQDEEMNTKQFNDLSNALLAIGDQIGELTKNFGKQPKPNTPPNEDSTTESNGVSSSEFNTLKATLDKLANDVAAFSGKPDEQTPAKPEPKADVITSEQFSALTKSLGTLTNDFSALKKEFNTETPGTPVPETSDDGVEAII